MEAAIVSVEVFSASDPAPYPLPPIQHRPARVHVRSVLTLPYPAALHHLHKLRRYGVRVVKVREVLRHRDVVDDGRLAWYRLVW